MVKQGYKKTEVGMIPEEWTFNALKYLMRIENGSRNTEHKTDEGKYPFFVRSQKVENIDTYHYDCEAVLTAGDGVGTGKVFHYYVGKFDAHQRVYVMSNFDGVLGRYFYNYFSENFGKEVAKYTAKSSVDSVRRDMIAEMIIPIPPLAEQERIAEALSDVDSMISSLEKLIAKKKVIKQGAMQELLTGKKRLSDFDGEWKTVSLGEIGLLTGSGVDKKILADELPITLLNYTNVYNQISIARKDLNHQVTASIEKIKNCSILKEDVFLTPTSETPEDIALSAVASEDMSDVVYSYHVVRLRPHSYYNGNFINYALLTPIFREQAIRYAEGSGIRYVITLKKFKEMMLYIPTDKKEQDLIASILSDMDNEIEALEQKLAKTRQLKQGMMQQLLTGKIRLIEKETITDITAEPDKLPETKTGHNHQFDDAVMIAAIVNAFYSDRYPLGRKKVQKLLYLLRRKQEEDTSAFKKKAAGPYADEIRYKGGEPIARKQGYIATATTQKGTTFAKGQAIDVAISYVGKWQMQSDIDWLVSTFKYTKTNDLELYATIDMAICDLQHEGIAVSVDSVKDLIRSNKEWKEKLTKTYFSDADIARAIVMCKRLYL